MSSRSDRAPRVRIPLAVVPLLVYLGVTVVTPALNGAARRDGFGEHAAVTVLVSGALAWLWCGLSACGGAWRRPVAPQCSRFLRFRTKSRNT